MLNDLFIFIVALFMVVKGATSATQYASTIARSYKLSKYIVGFIVIAIISILPETFISINAAIDGIPSFGLGVLFGSNIADLTLIFAIITFFAGRSLKIEGKIVKNRFVYPLILLVPLVLGLNGNYSRFEGLALIVTGGVFYYLALKDGTDGFTHIPEENDRLTSIAKLLFSMALLLVGAHFTVTSATSLAYDIGVNPILIGMLVVGLGTTIPEFIFSLKSVKKHDDSLAVGDILGTVLADATIVVGILAVINPFSFPKRIVYTTGFFMVLAAFLLFYLMKTGRTLSRREALLLLAFWITFAFVEFTVNAYGF